MKIIAFFVALLVSTSAFGGISVSPPISAGGIAAAGGVTNGGLGSVLTVANPSGNYLTDYANLTSSVPGQVAVTWAHNGSGQDLMAMFGSATAGNYTNGFNASWIFPQGIAEIGNFYWTDIAPVSGMGPGDGFQNMYFNMGMGPSNSAIERVWGTNITGLTTNLHAFQPYYNFANANPWSGGAGLNILSASTNSIHGSFIGNDSHGNPVYMPVWGMMLAMFGDALSLPTNGGFDVQGHEMYQIPSYQALLNDTTIPFVIGWNFVNRAGDRNIAGTQAQIPTFYIDPTKITPSQPNFIARFPFQKPNVWDPRYNPLWEDSLRIDEWSNIVTVGNQLLVKTNITSLGTFTGYQAFFSDKLVSSNNGYSTYGSGAGYEFDDRANHAAQNFTWYANNGVAYLYAGINAISFDTLGNQTNAGNLYAKTFGFTVTNTVLPIVPVSGQVVLGAGGLGGTNLYIIFKDSTGANRTNKIAVIPGYP